MLKKPNILIFMTDQQRGATILSGSPVRTPVMDRFLREGVCFTNARCPSPHCCPSRATFFTGLYPTEHGVWNNVAVQNTLSRDLTPGTRLWNQPLAEAGYRCHFAGKWHVSYDQAPRDFGWNEHHVTAPPAKDRGKWMGLDWDRYAIPCKEPDTRTEGGILRPGYGPYTHYGINERPFGDQGVVDHGIEALRSIATDPAPWCLYIGTLGPHDPYHVPQRFLDLYADDDIELPGSFEDRMEDKPALYRRTRQRFDQLTPDEHREAIRHYRAFCSYEDWLFGQVMEDLDRSGQADNTLVIFCSDHGDYLGDHGLWCKGLPCFRGAYEVPLAMRWPAGLRQPGRRVDAKVGLEDIARTLLDVAGCASEAAAWPGSGRSLRPFLENRPPEHWRTAHCTQTNGNELYGIQRSIDTGDWKYVYNGFDFDELYDLKADPGETRNLAADPACAATVRELCARLWAFGREHGEQAINNYIMVALAPVGPQAAFTANGEPIASGG